MKNFKGIAVAVLIIAVSVMAAGEVFAQRGMQGCWGNKGNAAVANPGTCPMAGACGRGMCGNCGCGSGFAVNIFAGEAFNISGTVTTVGIYGQGIEVKTDTETLTVYGLGPVRFWNSIGVGRPAAGDAVKVEGYKVTFADNSVRNIAVKVTVDGKEVELRDAETGEVLWSGNGRWSSSSTSFKSDSGKTGEMLILAKGGKGNGAGNGSGSGCGKGNKGRGSNGGNGPGDGTGNGGIGPKDGTGPRSKTGTCINS